MRESALRLETPKPLTVGEAIAKARDDAGMDQGELADVLGVSRTKMSRLENDRVSPRLSEIDVVVKATGAHWLWRHITSYVALVEMPAGQMVLPAREFADVVR